MYKNTNKNITVNTVGATKSQRYRHRRPQSNCTWHTFWGPS